MKENLILMSDTIYGTLDNYLFAFITINCSCTKYHQADVMNQGILMNCVKMVINQSRSFLATIIVENSGLGYFGLFPLTRAMLAFSNGATAKEFI